MPQMNPMSWILLFIYFIYLFYLFILFIYFNIINKCQNNNLINKIFTKSMNWKW
uniref:ATP synthase complex subunit 8 n=1 Tax=Kisaura zhejiangensis (nom. nud.) TaxID=2904921 RepID=A0A9E8RUS2_9NEOP|nr:ATP synthase F0 subunit 8 [Kisaura zhejiangensis (nom. nud.)]UZZ44068.1 ATP synthase F0 subunit 8 [Kisaura zhejiangensis (nom. nud.)]